MRNTCFCIVSTQDHLNIVDFELWKPLKLSLINAYLLPQKLVVWVTSFRLGHSSVWAVHCMRCTAWTGEWPNLKEVAQTTNFCVMWMTEPDKTMRTCRYLVIGLGLEVIACIPVKRDPYINLQFIKHISTNHLPFNLVCRQALPALVHKLNANRPSLKHIFYKKSLTEH